MTLENGHLLKERYRILDILGQGGMGAVYRAIDENLEITVAVKENSFQSEEYTRQFRREARILASLRHPNLPRVFDYFVLDQQGQYLVMDYIEGADLRQWMQQEDFISENEALLIGVSICDALIYLHGKQPPITHRDIKPGNIKITPNGEIVLVDFGLVKQSKEKELTTTAARAMTPGYSPPEQYGETPTDQRSDIFSLGATLYAAMAGYVPEDSLSRASGKCELTPLRHYNPLISKKTADVIEKAIKLQYRDRWQTAAEFKQALMDARDTLPQEEWASRRLASPDHPKNDEADSRSFDTKVGQWFNKTIQMITGGANWQDPVWLIFAIMIFLLILFLGMSLIWPNGFQAIFARAPGDSPTATLVMSGTLQKTRTQSVNRATATNEPPVETQTPVVENTLVPEVVYTQTPIGGRAGVIAFVSERTGVPQIWQITLADSKLTQLTDLEDGACQPDWSPDGEKIVFTSPCPGKRERYLGSSLYILDLVNDKLMILPTSLEGNFDPAWSPDGRWIAYTSLVNGQMQILKVNVDNQTIIKLSDGSFNEFEPAWSEDGSRLVFIRIRVAKQVWLMDADGDNPVQFSLSGQIDNSNPVLYSKEDLILYSQALGPGSPSKQLVGMRLEDTGMEEEYPILPNTSFDYIPLMDNVDVSPDGTLLAFDLWYYDVLSDIYIMRFPGSNLRQVTFHAGMDYDPVWRP